MHVQTVFSSGVQGRSPTGQLVPRPGWFQGLALGEADARCHLRAWVTIGHLLSFLRRRFSAFALERRPVALAQCHSPSGPHLRALEDGISCGVVHSGSKCTMAFPSPSLPSESSGDRIRLTISVTPEVHATFQRMSAASGMSLGKAMGDWLQDTEEAAREMTVLLERARAAPKLVLKEMNSFLLGMAAETEEMINGVREKSRATVTGAQVNDARQAPAAGSPRPVIRGVKSTSVAKGKARARKP